MLDYDKIYAGFGEQVKLYLDRANQATYETQKARLRRVANLAWILMNQPAGEDGCIGISLEDILNMLSDVNDEKKVSVSVLQSDMHELVAGTNITFDYSSKDGKIFIKPARIIKAK